MSQGTVETRDCCILAFDDVGQGLPVLWQHGLGADRSQPAEVFPDTEGLRRITLECRGHGASALGRDAAISIARFTEDAMALLDHLGVERAVVGGISLGAAIALRIAALHPDRVLGLVLARPAWVDEDAPATLRLYRDVAELLAAYGPEEGRRRFEALPGLAEVEAVSPDNAASLRGFFDRRDPSSTIALLSRIPGGGPGVSRQRMQALDVATMIVANDRDYVHPLETARRLAGLIPGAQFREITSKTVDRTRYVDEFKATLGDFLDARKGAS
ncbi:MAG TPA: alpha/beta hydrolase [Lichenihabitans sp.]|jgi:pimeloyl-ACP methyl ester carboxylesterase|nr:alpha/beta hydrolase [Lichenihabitans sp.]